MAHAGGAAAVVGAVLQDAGGVVEALLGGDAFVQGGAVAILHAHLAQLYLLQGTRQKESSSCHKNRSLLMRLTLIDASPGIESDFVGPKA